MNDVSKKHILNLCVNELSNEFVNFFEEISFTVHAEFNDSQEYDYILIDKEETSLPVAAPVVFIGQPQDMVSFFKNNGRAMASEEILSSEIEKVILKRLLGVSSSLSLEKAFNNELNSAGSFKLTDHLSTGHYCDLIASKASIEDYNFLNIRNGFFHLSNFISLTIDSKSGHFPVDVEFGSAGDKFVIQSHYNVENFGAEYLWRSLSDLEDNFLKKSLEYVDAIDCYILEKTGRLVLTLIFSKERSQKQSIFIHNIKSFKLINLDDLVNNVAENNIDSIEDLKQAKNKVKSISKVQDLLDDEQASDGHLVSVTRVSKFLNSLESDLSNLSLENFDEFVQDYPNKKMLNFLTVNDKKLIIDSVKNDEKLSTLSTSLEEVEEVVGLDEFLESLVHKIDGLSLDEANEIVALSSGPIEKDAQTRVSSWLEKNDDRSVISGNKEDLGEETTLVSGSSEVTDDSSTLVSGTREDIGDGATLVSGTKDEIDNSTTIISGTREDLGEGSTFIAGTKEDLTEEAILISGEQNSDQTNSTKSFSIDSSETKAEWRSAKSDIIEEVRKRALKLKESGKSLKDLNKEVSGIVSDKLNIDSSESETLSKGLFENASEKFVTNKNIGKGNGGENTRNRLENEKLKQDVKRKDSQLIRMKRLIDGMKKEISIQRDVSQEGESANSESGAINTPVNYNIEVNKLKAEVERRDKQIEQMKKNLDVVHNLNKDEDDDISDSLITDDLVVQTNSVKNLELEVKRLSSQLELSQKREEQISQKIENEKELSESKTSNETRLFREKITKSQEIINKYQAENADFQKQIFELKRKKEEFENKANLLASNDSTEQLKEKEKEFSEVSKLAKQAEDRYRAAGLRIKQLEQKNKFLTSQVETASKKNSKSAAMSGGGKLDAKSAHKIKQLERMNDKLKGSSKKFEDELAGKKKELHQGKLENNTLKLKVDELERKLSKFDKKAA